MPSLDVPELRRQFPALSLTQDGKPIVLFDGPGGTQVPDRVIDAVARYYRESNANSGGSFLTSQRSDEVVESSREAMADFLNAPSVEEIKFGQNMTSLTFHLSRSIGATLSAGDEIVVTTLDHDANVAPWQAIAADQGLTIRTVDIHPEDCTLDLDDLDAKLSQRTKLVAFGYASNATGTINPVEEIVRRARAVGALTYLDAVHYAPHGPIDVQALGVDFLVCSVYKFFGPHLGVVFGREAVLDRLPAYKVRPAHDRFETGTPNFEGIAGAAAAVGYLSSIGERFGPPYVAEFSDFAGRRLTLKTAMRAVRVYEMALFERLVVGLEQIPGLRIWGISDHARFHERTPTVAITLATHTPREAVTELGKRGIAAWDGDFYARGLVERLGLGQSGGLIRIGLIHYNTLEEVERLIGALGEIVALARSGVATWS